jgi:ketosteroid isomerase-like protein
MTHDEVQQWLVRYIAAWASNDPRDIGDLFTGSVVYSYRPWENDDVTLHGRDAVIAAWQRQFIDSSYWEAHYEPFVVEGDQAVAVGWSKYQPIGGDPERTFQNAYLLKFEDGRCSSFHEFWMIEKEGGPVAGMGLSQTT